MRKTYCYHEVSLNYRHYYSVTDTRQSKRTVAPQFSRTIAFGLVTRISLELRSISLLLLYSQIQLSSIISLKELRDATNNDKSLTAVTVARSTELV